MALAVLAACQTAPPAPPPAVEIAPPPEPLPLPVPEISAQSRALRVYYARMQAELLAQGRLRGDSAPTDAAFDAATLARNFVRIALYSEYVERGGTLQPEAQLSRLTRWEQPVRIAAEFGARVEPDQATRDRASLAAYAGRLERASGHPIRMVESGANFHVLFLTEDDRIGIEPRLRELVPGIEGATLRAIMEMPRSTLCLVVGFSQGGGYSYDRAVAIIRAEHPDLMRLACIHEEVAQGLGLVNDSPEARPTIFNDNEEFGLLTRHDELLLKILYDPRLRAGMPAAEAAPIARQIAEELLAVPS
jgi:hypothetical protein